MFITPNFGSPVFQGQRREAYRDGKGCHQAEVPFRLPACWQPVYQYGACGFRMWKPLEVPPARHGENWKDKICHTKGRHDNQGYPRQTFSPEVGQIQQTVPYPLCHDRCQAGYTEGTPVLLRCSKNEGWWILLTTGTSIDFMRAYEIYAMRRSIEVFFSDSKRLLGLSNCSGVTSKILCLN